MSRKIFIQLRVLIFGAAFAGLIFGFNCSAIFGHESMHAQSNFQTNLRLSAISHQECCDTSIGKNFQQWQSVVSVVPRETKDGFALLLISLALAFFASWPRFVPKSSDQHAYTYRLYARNNPDLSLFNVLKLAFVRGILNPKVF